MLKIGLDPASSKTALMLAWVATMVANVLSWVYNIYLNSVLDLGEFAQVAVILNSVMILSTVTLALQFAVTNFIPYKSSRFLSTAFLTMSLGGLFSWFLFLLCMPGWVEYVQLTLSPGTLFWFSAVVMGLFLSSLVRGVLYGRRSYYALSVVLIAEGVVKVVAVFLARYLPVSLFPAAVLAIPLSMLLPYGLYLPWLWSKLSFSFRFSWVWFKRLFRFAAASYITVVSAQLFLFTDVVMVKHYLPSDQAGVYATLALIGKMIYFLTTSIVNLVMPEVAVRRAAHAKVGGILFKSLAFTSVVGILSTAVVALYPQSTLELFLDPQKVALASPYVALYGLVITLISAVVVTSAFLIFSGYRWLIVVIVTGIFSQIILLSLFHQTISAIVWVMLLVSLGVFLSLLGVSFVEHRYRNINSVSPGKSVLPAS